VKVAPVPTWLFKALNQVMVLPAGAPFTFRYAHPLPQMEAFDAVTGTAVLTVAVTAALALSQRETVL
jgi:hypothetical protein